MTGPRRRASDDHNHPEYWSREDHHRFEDRLTSQIGEMRDDLDQIANRLTLLLGGIALLAFVFPFLLPFLQRLFGLPVT